MCLVQALPAEWQHSGHHVGVKAPAAAAANAALPLPATLLASEPYFAALKCQSPYAMLASAPANAGFVSRYSTDMPGCKAQKLESGSAMLPGSFSGSSTSSGQCLGKIPSGSVPTQGPPTTPATPKSTHSAFNIPVAAPEPPHSAINIPVASLTHPATADWGSIRPEHSSLQLQPSMHHDQQSARAAPLSFSTHQQCWTVPGQPLATLQRVPSSLQQPYLATQQQRELLFAAPHEILDAPQQSPTSPHVAPWQLQKMLLHSAPAISHQREERNSHALSGTHHHVSGSYQLCSFKDGLTGPDHATGLQSGVPCFENGMQALKQQLKSGTNVRAALYIPTSYCAQTASRAGAQPRSSPELPS